MPREGEVVVDCIKVRKLILEECRLSASGAEKRMNIAHAVWHRLLGGSKYKQHDSVITKDFNAREVIRLAQDVLKTDPPLSIEAIIFRQPDVGGTPPQTGAASVPMHLFGSERCIAIVEDDREVREGIAKYLAREGFHVRTYGNGVAALEALLAQPVDLLILDLQLPGLQGEDVLQEVRKLHSFPVIIITSKSDEVDEIMNLRLGADDYVTKPFNVRVLLERIRTVLRRWDRRSDGLN